MIRLAFGLMARNTLKIPKAYFRFSSDQEPPKGFSKFQRKPKQTQQAQDPKVEGDKPKEQTVEQPKEQKKQPEEVEENIIEENEDKPVKPQKKKYTFTYDPKSFNINNEKQQQQEEEPEQEKPDQENKEKSKKPPLNFEDVKKYFKSPQNRNLVLIFLGICGASVSYALFTQVDHISYNEFVKQYLDASLVSKIVIEKKGAGHYSAAYIHTTRGETKLLVLGNVDHFLENLERIQVEKGYQADQFVPVEFGTSVETSKVINSVLQFFQVGLSIVLIVYFYRSLKSTMSQMGKGGGNDIFGFGKSNVKQFGFEQSVKVKFKDVAGLDEAKLEIQEFVDFLKKPRKYKEMGAKIPRGALLAGPPGTGKTMVAKACAGEAGVPFFYVSGSDFVEMFVGVGASRVRDLFKQAKQKAPSIVFIDEIDAVGRKRESRVGGNDERDNTLNQLLVEMDGFGTDSNVIVLAATNRKELLDPALTRPGRFDRTVDITLPDIGGRQQIFLVHLQPIKLDPSKNNEEYAKRLATLTPGFSGAEIANLCNEAAIMAARANKLFVDSNDFEMASERVMAGLEKKKIISEEERKIVAYHESGHAVVSWFLEGGSPLLKLTIIPRSKGSLGYAQYLPNESSLETKSELLDRICCILGGRISEDQFFGQVTTGAYDDLKKAYEVAHSIVTKFGMSDLIGYVGFQEGEFSKSYSDQTNRDIDNEIKKIIDECTVRTRELIKKHQQDIQNLATTLLEKESLDLQKIVQVLGERPFAPKSNYKAYLDIKKLEHSESQAAQDQQQVDKMQQI